MFESLSNDPQGESLDLREGSLLALAVREDAGQFDDFCQPATVVLLLHFDLKRSQRLTTFESRVYDDQLDQPHREGIQITGTLSGRTERRRASGPFEGEVRVHSMPGSVPLLSSQLLPDEGFHQTERTIQVPSGRIDEVVGSAKQQL